MRSPRHRRLWASLGHTRRSPGRNSTELRNNRDSTPHLRAVSEGESTIVAKRQMCKRDFDKDVTGEALVLCQNVTNLEFPVQNSHGP